MEWLRQNYERGLALGAALFLVLSVVLVALRISNFRGRFALREEGPSPNQYKITDKSNALAQARQELRVRVQWKASGSGLFVPEKYFLDANGEPTRLQGTLLHPPIPNDWWEEFGLPIGDPEVLTQDPDSDGFTNREEWEGHTSPVDRDSHPPYTSKLKLRSASEEAFPLIFSSSIGDIFAINNLDRSKPTQFLHLGEMVNETKYKLTKYYEKHAINKYGTTIDVSELTLEQVATHEVVRLVKEQPTISPESVANFIYSWGGTEQNFSVKKDQEFALKPVEEVKYRLQDVQSHKAIIVAVGKAEEAIEIYPADIPEKPKK